MAMGRNAHHWTRPNPSRFYAGPARRRSRGDSIGLARAQKVVPVSDRGLQVIAQVMEQDAYLRLTRKAVVKWHGGLLVRNVVAYRSGYIVEIDRPDGNGRAFIAAVDVDAPTPRSIRIRAIGTRLMAFLHHTAVEAETTMHRYFYSRDPKSGVLGPPAVAP